MTSLAEIYKRHFRHKGFLISVILSIALLAVSLVVNFYAGMFATEKASNSVTDIVLSNIPVFDVDGIFVYGPFVFWIFVAALCFKKLNRIPFILKSVALFVLIRSLFITLTHIGPFPSQITVVGPLNIFEKLTFGGDLFFSGHTGLPFLMALVFWENVRLRVFFIAAAIFFGAIVLMAHLHYSIDVLSAFFITYTIYHIAEIMFKNDKKLFMAGIQE